MQVSHVITFKAKYIIGLLARNGDICEQQWFSKIQKPLVFLQIHLICCDMSYLSRCMWKKFLPIFTKKFRYNYFFFLTHFHVKFGLLISTKKIHDLKLYYSIICMYTVELEVKSHSLFVAESDLFVQIKNGNNNQSGGWGVGSTPGNLYEVRHICLNVCFLRCNSAVTELPMNLFYIYSSSFYLNTGIYFKKNLQRCMFFLIQYTSYFFPL